MLQNHELELFGFYPLLWQFGDYLYRKVKDDQLFSLSKVTQKFLHKYSYDPKLVEYIKPKIKHIKSLFNQNYVFVRPAPGYRARSRRRNMKNQALKNTSNSSSVYDMQEDGFYLSPTWRKILLYDQHISQYSKPYGSGKSLSSSKKVSSRDTRTIGVLGFRLTKMLQNKPCTREIMGNVTGFSRQRICTVLSIYKSVNLISDDQSNGYVCWNHGNGQVISEMKQYLENVILLRKKKRELAQRVLELSKKMKNTINEKIENQNNKKKPKSNSSEIQLLKTANKSVNNLFLILKILLSIPEKKKNENKQNENDMKDENCVEDGNNNYDNGKEKEEEEQNEKQKIKIETKSNLNQIQSEKLIKSARKAIKSVQQTKNILKRLNEESKKHLEFNKLFFKKRSNKKISYNRNKLKYYSSENSDSTISSLSSSSSELSLYNKFSHNKKLKYESKKNKNCIRSKRKYSKNKKKKLYQKNKKKMKNKMKSKNKNKSKHKIKLNKKKINKKLYLDNNDKENTTHDETVNDKLMEKWRKKSSQETEAILAILRLKTKETETIQPMTLMIDNEIQQLDTSQNITNICLF
ncbi:hypothetical protein M0813_09948 [Anaeramoeba flamelloides]|uniref:Uncharacterized protein n=1 Tax=Anaeramoeba flamelloides TaxID=1746091 RepID=A0ABQ8X3Y2_9EUKA|nr:hypothetical protein M0813_09948 [Anaeramoeba flamelloides]